METVQIARASEGPGLLESVWRYRFAVACAVVLGAVAAYALSAQSAPVFEATSRLILSDPRNAQLFGELRGTVEDPGRYVRNQAEVIRSGAVHPRAAELLDGRLTAEELREQVSIDVFNDVDLVVVRAVDGTAEGAAEIANAIAEAYQDFYAEQIQETAAAGIAELRLRNDALRDELDSLDEASGTEDTSPQEAERTAAVDQIVQNEGRIEQLTVDAAVFGSGVDVFSRAQVPLAPVQPRPLLTAVAGLLLTAAAASGVAWWRNRASQRITTAHEAARILDAPLLGEIPDYGKAGFAGAVPTLTDPRSMVAEAYQFVASALSLRLGDLQGRSILVTSCAPGDGKTVTALNVALAAGRDRRSVVLVDTDQRALGLTRLCSETFDVEFPERTADDDGREWVAAPLVGEGEELPLTLVSIALELDDPASYFRTGQFRRRIAWVKQRGDLVLLDSPPLLAVSETAIIASQVEGVLLVVNRGMTLRLLREVKHRLDFVGTPVVGFVFNRASPRGASQGYAYGYGYGYGATDGRTANDRSDRPAAPARALPPASVPPNDFDPSDVDIAPLGWPGDEAKQSNGSAAAAGRGKHATSSARRSRPAATSTEAPAPSGRRARGAGS